MNQISKVSSDMSAAVAVELASGLWPEGDVFARNGIDPLYGAALLRTDWFKKMVDTARSEWASIKNTRERIRLKSQLAVEMSLNDVYGIVVDAKTAPAARVAAFKELKDLSGSGGADPNAGTGATVPTVNIFLGEGRPVVSVQSRQAPAIDAEDAVEVTPSDLDEVDVDSEEFLGVMIG